MRVQHAWIISMCGLCVLGMPGCKAGKSGQSARPTGVGAPTIQVTPADVERYKDPVEVSKLRERALDVLMESAKGGEDLARATSMEALLLAPGRLPEVVGPALADQNIGVRAAAALAVGRAKLKALVPQVEPLVNDADARVRASALYALDANGVKADLTPLAGMLMQGSTTQVRSQAAFVLGEMRDASALPMLKEAAKQSVTRATPIENRLFQLQIAEAMAKLGDETQIEVVRAALYPSRPEDLEASALAIQILGQLRDRGAIDNLIYVTAWRSEKGERMPAELRLGAAGALARMGLTQGSFLADEFAGNALPALRAQSAFVYGEIGRTENLPKLEKLLADPEPAVRVAAAAAIVKTASNQSPNRAVGGR
jgi:HEAT repeat protein